MHGFCSMMVSPVKRSGICLADRASRPSSNEAVCCQVMRMALTKRKKAVGFVSSVGILSGIGHPEAVLESEDAHSLASEHAGDGAYAMG